MIRSLIAIVILLQRNMEEEDMMEQQGAFYRKMLLRIGKNCDSINLY